MWPFGFCLCVRADCLEAKLTLDRDLSMMFRRYPLALRCCLNFKRPSSNISFGEFVLSNLIASPLRKPCFTPGGWHEAKCVNWKVSVGLLWVLDFSKSLSSKHCDIEEGDLVLWYFVREFDTRMEIVTSFNIHLLLLCLNPKGRKRLQCNVSYLLAWFRFVKLISFQFPPWKYWQMTLPIFVWVGEVLLIELEQIFLKD